MTATQDRLGAEQDHATARSVLLEMAAADLFAPDSAVSAAEPLQDDRPVRTQQQPGTPRAREQTRFTLGVLYATLRPTQEADREPTDR